MGNDVMFSYLDNGLDSALRYVSKDIHSVDGWFGQQQIDLVNTVNKIHYLDGVRGNFLEIGVHHGRLFCFVRHLLRSEEVAFGIDVFEDQQYNVDGSGNGNLEKFRQNIEAYGRGLLNVEIIKSDSSRVAAADILSRGRGHDFRLIHIDGSCVASDLALSAQLLGPYGVVIVDDYQSMGWPGVSEGAARYMLLNPTCRLAPVALGYGKGIFTLKDNQRRFLSRFVEVNELKPYWIRRHYDCDVVVF